MKISRKRWVIIKNTAEGQEIFCGLARNYQFKPIDNIGDTAIKTYLSRNKAISAFNTSWSDDFDNEVYQAIEVEETIKAIEV